MSEPTPEYIADQANYGEEREKAEYDEILLDGVSIRVASIQSTDLARLEGKVTFGDYTAESDQQTSSDIKTSWQGGALIGDQVEGATDQRFRWGDLWTFSPGQLSLSAQMAGTQLRILDNGEINGNSDNQTVPIASWNGFMWVAAGTKLYKISGFEVYDPTAWIVTYVGELAGVPCDNGAVYGNPEEGTVRLWIPIWRPGSSTYALQTVNDTGTINAVDTTHQAVSICVWDRRLMCLTNDGYLRYYSMLGVWDTPDAYRRIPLEQTPKHVRPFFDRSGNKTVFVSTDRQMFGYDQEGDILVETSLEIPYFLSNGSGFVSWRDDAIYYSSGLGITRYSSSGVMTEMGLDRDDGVPPDEFFSDGRGILNLYPARNFLVAVVHAGSRLVSGVQTWRYHVTAYNEAGWHILYSYDSTKNYLTTYGMQLLVADVVGGYRIWIGAREQFTSTDSFGFLFSINIPRGGYGPKQIIAQQIAMFKGDGKMKTGWFDATMEGFDKLFSHVEVRTQKTGAGTDLAGYVQVWYHTEDDPDTWVQLGTVTKFGTTVLPFGIDADGFPRGIASSRIEFEYRFHTTDLTVSPVVRSINNKFIKLPLFARAWVMSVPLDSEITNQGLSSNEIDEYLSRKLIEGPFQKLIVDGTAYRVRVVQWQGRESIHGGQKTGSLNLVGLQIPHYEIPGVRNV